MDSIFRETDTEIKRDGDVFYFDCLAWFCYCGSSFFVSNPYHVVLNRQLSGERGDFLWD